MVRNAFIAVMLAVMVGFEMTLSQQPANDVCFACGSRRNHKDLYADPNDCHRFVQCFYYSPTFAIGLPRSCPNGTFWNDAVLQCLPEGDVTCTDICNSQTPPTSGCYGVTDNCAAFFVCSNMASYAFCCPPSTRFNASSCSCGADATCTDICTVKSNTPTTLKPPVVIDNVTCEDSFDNTLQIVDDQPGLFAIWDEAMGVFHQQSCAPGTIFQLENCRCDVSIVDSSNPPPPSHQCSLYLPFDTDINDQSVSDYQTYGFGTFDIDSTTVARGAGSLYVNVGRVEIPGLKSIDFQKQASWCLYFKQENASGGLLSNSEGTAHKEQSITLASTGGDAVVQVLLGFEGGSWLNVSSTNNGSTADTSSGFSQICFVYGDNTAQIYRNGELVWSTSASGQLGRSHCPYVVGTDQSFGHFNGWIDEVLICDFALTPSEVDAHWSGQAAMVSEGLVPESATASTATASATTATATATTATATTTTAASK